MLQELFIELAKQIIKQKQSAILGATFHASKMTYLRELKEELQSLKEAYAVVYAPDEQSISVDDAFGQMVANIMHIG